MSDSLVLNSSELPQWWHEERPGLSSKVQGEATGAHLEEGFRRQGVL